MTVRLVHSDDIALFLRSPTEHIASARKILLFPNNAEVRLRLKKCRFLTVSIDYLGHMVRLMLLEIASYTTDTIRELKATTNMTLLRSVFGQ